MTKTTISEQSLVRQEGRDAGRDGQRPGPGKEAGLGSRVAQAAGPNTGEWAGRHPGREDCLRMLEAYRTPSHVVGHCKAVAAAGYRLGRALNAKGYRLDLDLILAAGLLHDMARVEDMHWEVAARYCEVRGMRQEAAIIRVHMTYDPFHPVEALNETDVICLADRTVLEDRYAGLDRRIDYIIEKARRQGHPEHVPHILRKKGETQKLIHAIEALLGCSLDELMAGIDYEAEEANTR